MFKGILAISAALALAACGGPPNQKDPYAVAGAFASAFAREDVAALSTLMTSEAKNTLSFIAVEGQDGPTRAAFFNEELKASFANSRATSPPRFNTDGEVWMKMADTPDGLLTVRLAQVGESFWVKDAGIVDPAIYNALPTAPPKATTKP